MKGYKISSRASQIALAFIGSGTITLSAYVTFLRANGYDFKTELEKEKMESFLLRPKPPGSSEK